MADMAQIARAVEGGRRKVVDQLVREALAEGVKAETILNEGLVVGMTNLGEQFKNGEVYVPEVLVAARAMKTGTEILKPLLVAENVQSLGTVAIGTVEGDLHDIGKNLVGIMLKGAGYEVMDLGVNCDIAKYEDAVGKGAQIIGCSSLLTTTMPYMKDVVEHFKGKGVKVIIGGAPVTQAYADEIGADGYSDDANGAVKLVDSLMAC